MGASFRAAERRAGRFQVSEFPLIPPGHGQVQVRVSACSVCLTEVHYTDGYYDELAAPARLGHEFCGVVEAVGPGVTGLAQGSLVAGFDSFGGFGEIVTEAAGLFVPLPAGLPPDRGCLLEPVSCCVHAVRRAAVPPGATVLAAALRLPLPQPVPDRQLRRRLGGGRAGRRAASRPRA